MHQKEMRVLLDNVEVLIPIISDAPETNAGLLW